MRKAIVGAVVTGFLGVALSSGANAAPINVGGYSFSSSADSLISSQGSFRTSGGSVANVLTDLDAGTYAISDSPGAAVTLGFSSGIQNLSGVDLVLFESGVQDSFAVTINGATRDYLSVATGFFVGTMGLNAAAVDLSSFGLAPGDLITSLFIGLDLRGTDTGTVPSLSFAGVLNTPPGDVDVPEPITLSLFSVGVIGAFMMRRPHKTKKA